MNRSESQVWDSQWKAAHEDASRRARSMTNRDLMVAWQRAAGASRRSGGGDATIAGTIAGYVEERNRRGI